MHRYTGHIAGFGTAEGTRVVVGMWERTPLGRFTDVMVERTDGHRILYAPSAETAEFIAATYTFDEIVITPVSRRRAGGAGVRDVAVSAGPLEATLLVGGVSPLGVLLGLVPRGIATRRSWLRLIDPAARILVPGSRTAGTAGSGRHEYYGVTAARRISAVVATWNGESLGALARLDPPVRFGFGSAPADPHLVAVTTTIVERSAVARSPAAPARPKDSDGTGRMVG